jgi:branched-subunit amino acid transport protein
MAGITFAIRYLPFWAFKGVEFHGFIGRLINYLPPAIIGGLLSQILFTRDYRLYFQWDDFTLVATVMSTAIAIMTKSILLTVLIGMTIYALPHFFRAF